jgi:hypothetical protein
MQPLWLTQQWKNFVSRKYYPFFYQKTVTCLDVLSDSKRFWIRMAPMYANLCGNCVGGVELTCVWHFISLHLIFLYHCRLIWQFWKLRDYELSKKCQLAPTHINHSICTIPDTEFWPRLTINWQICVNWPLLNITQLLTR